MPSTKRLPLKPKLTFSSHLKCHHIPHEPSNSSQDALTPAPAQDPLTDPAMLPCGLFPHSLWFSLGPLEQVAFFPFAHLSDANNNLPGKHAASGAEREEDTPSVQSRTRSEVRLTQKVCVHEQGGGRSRLVELGNIVILYYTGGPGPSTWRRSQGIRSRAIEG